MNWICSQIGAREHYAIPRILSSQGKLDRLFTDFWAGPAARFFGPDRLKGRWNPSLEKAQVSGFNFTFFKNCLRPSPDNLYLGFIKTGSEFSKAVANQLKKLYRLNEKIFFSYDTSFLESAETAVELGFKTVVGQMDPSRVEYEIVRKEEEAFPDWVSTPTSIPEEYFERRVKEWQIADRIMVNSPWSRSALIQQGVPEDEISVIPLAFEAEDNSIAHRPNASLPLTVLFLGQVILRKGIHYLVETARLLEKEPVEFRVVGPLGINLEQIKKSPPNIRWLGPCSRIEVKQEYENADLFVLPTLSDGFAITQIEAMAYGVPVIATPNCGSVVDEGENGWVRPDRSPETWAEKINEILTNPRQLDPMRERAHQKSKQFSLSQLGEHLANLELQLLP